MSDTLGNPLFSCSLDVTDVEPQHFSKIEIHQKVTFPEEARYTTLIFAS